MEARTQHSHKQRLADSYYNHSQPDGRLLVAVQGNLQSMNWAI
jgi:hypothetical protein